MTQLNLTTYSLGLEELSLGLGMLNRPDLSQAIMHSVYENLTDEQMDARLISAGNSLLARNLCSLTNKGIPNISQEFLTALFPLAHYDLLLRLSLITDDIKVTTVHIQRGKQFTSHTSVKGIIHVLEHGNTLDLPQYLKLYFNGFGKGSNRTDYEKVPQSLLNKPNLDREATESILIQQGWLKPNAKELSRDLSNPIFRGSMMRVDAHSKMNGDETLKAQKHGLFLLQGKKDRWIMELPTIDHEFGSAKKVTNQEFKKAVVTFLS